ALGVNLSFARCLAGSITDGTELTNSDGVSGKVSGIYRMLGKDQTKLSAAQFGETVALGKLDEFKTGDTLSSARGGIAPLAALKVPEPVFAIALRSKERQDGLKASDAI